jgi:RNA polymerase sigma-70 factor (ECF subfamily)
MFFKKKDAFDENDLNSVITACLGGNKNAQRILIKMHLAFAKMLSRRYSASKEEQEEIINDSFLKMFTHLAKYDYAKPFQAWLRSIIVNTAIDHFRKNQKFSYQTELHEVELNDFNVDIIGKIAADEILFLVKALPPAYRMVFTLYAIDGYSHKEIADKLGIREGTSKSNLRDARIKLQLMIKEHFPQYYLAYGVKTSRIHEN